MSQPRPFKINVPQADIDALKRKLAETRFPDELEESGWTFGSPLADVKRLVNRWQTDYDWKTHEKHLNDTLSQFTIDIPVDGHDTLGIHFIHQRSASTQAIPLLFLHGCTPAVSNIKRMLTFSRARSL